MSPAQSACESPLEPVWPRARSVAISAAAGMPKLAAQRSDKDDSTHVLRVRTSEASPSLAEPPQVLNEAVARKRTQPKPHAELRQLAPLN